MTNVPSDPRAWLEESAWLHRLARRLVHESAHAEDLAQDALLVAWGRPPREGVPVRAWLAGVLRKLARVRHRGAVRREARERRVPSPEEGDETARTVERLELQERLVAAVRKLDEPYRTTVTLRFLDDLAPAEIAERLGVPVKTVHTRIERALARLRERFDREFGQRAAWATLLVPDLRLAAPTVASLAPLTSIPFFAMGTATKWAAATAAVAVIGFFVVRALGAPGALPVAASATDSATADLHVAPGGDALRATSQPRTQVAAAIEVHSRPDSVPTEPLLHGFVRDLERRPVAGLDVGYVTLDLAMVGSQESPVPAKPASTTSGGDGAFVLPLFATTAKLAASGGGFATIYGPSLVGTVPPEPPVVFVGPVREFAGIVQDRNGVKIAGADVEVRLAEAVAKEIDGGTLATTLPVSGTTTDAQGHFVLPPFGHAPGSRISVHAKGFVSTSSVLPELSDPHLVVTLVPSAPARGRYEGRVEHADGTPAAEAHLCAGGRAIRCDAAGRFEWTPEFDETPTRLVAVLRGFQPATLSLTGLSEDQRLHLRLVLGPAAPTIAGSVRDARGLAVAGARVWTQDGERFGTLLTKVGAVYVAMSYDVEAVIDGLEDGPADGRERRADAEGAFELTGLADRTYRVWAQRLDTFEIVGPVEVAAGRRDVELRFAGTERTERVAGRVLTGAGKPIAGATVRIDRSRQLVDGSRVNSDDSTSARRTTDAEGRFAFDVVCVAGTSLVATLGEALGSGAVALDAARDLQGVELRIPQVCYLRVELTQPDAADMLQIRDARGTNLEMQFEIGGLRMRAPGVQILDGKTERLAVVDTARTVVLRRDGQEVASLPLVLVPGEVQTVKW